MSLVYPCNWRAARSLPTLSPHPSTVRMSDWLQSRLGLSPELQVKFLVTLLTVFGLWLLHWIVLSLVYRRRRGAPRRAPRGHSITPAGLAGGGLLVGRAWVLGGSRRDKT